MKRKWFWACLLALPLFGCAGAKDLGTSLDERQEDDVRLMKSLFGGEECKYDVAMDDYDKNGTVDISLKYLYGCEKQSDDQKLEAIASVLGMLMAGCGYKIDKVYVDIKAARYEGLFSNCVKCASMDKGKEENCLNRLWKLRKI